MSDIKLKPCPLCQSPHVCIMLSPQQEDGSRFYYGFCYECSAEAGEGDTKKQAAEAWNSLPRHLHWTTEPPTEPGWYWCRSNVQPKDAAIVLVRDGAFELDEELIEAASLRFQWAGPIPEPQEPK